MRGEFSKKTRELFDLGGYMRSWESGQNNASEIHHILGRSSNSPYNAAPINSKEHMPEGRMSLKLPPIHCFETHSKYLKKTKKYLDSIGYAPIEQDEEFLGKYSHYYEEFDDELNEEYTEEDYRIVSSV